MSHNQGQQGGSFGGGFKLPGQRGGSPFDFLRSSGGFGKEDFERAGVFAVGKGNNVFRVAGFSGPGGIKNTLNRAQAERLVRRRGGGSTLFDQFSQALFDPEHGDIATSLRLAKEQRGRVNTEIEGLRGFLGGIEGEFGALAEAQAGRLGEEAQGLRDLGAEQVGAFGEFREGILGEVSGRIDKGIQGFESAIDEFRTSQDQGLAASVAASIQEQVQGQQTQIQSGVRADGTIMTEQEKAQAMQALQFQTARRTQQAVTGIQQQTEQTILAAEQSLGALRLQGASTFGQTGVALGAQTVQIFQNQARLAEAAANLGLQAEQFRSVAQLNAVNLRLQTRLAIAELVQSNPESMVSIFGALASLFSVRSIPGGPASRTPLNLPGRRQAA